MARGASPLKLRAASFFEECLEFGDDFKIFRTAGSAFKLYETLESDEAARNTEDRKFFRKRQQMVI